MPQRQLELQALARVLASTDAVRNGPALFLMLGTFATAGLALGVARAAFARDAFVAGLLESGLALVLAFYGANAAGLALMDQARGLPPRPARSALADALRGAHRLLPLLAAIAAGLVLVAAIAAALLALARLPGLGPVLFGLVLPLAVLGCGLALLVSLVAGPLCLAAVWSGMAPGPAFALMLAQLRRRLLPLALLLAAASGLGGAVGAVVTLVVAGGARIVAVLAPWASGLNLPPQQWLAGLFGQGLRGMGNAGMAVVSAHEAAALVSGNAVFVIALVLPAMVYLRGLCAVFLALQDAAGADPG